MLWPNRLFAASYHVEDLHAYCFHEITYKQKEDGLLVLLTF